MIRTFFIVWASLQICFAENSYMASFPNALIPGIPLNVRVHILKSSGDVHVNVRLKHLTNGSVVTQTDKVIQQGMAQIVPLEVPTELEKSDYKVGIIGSRGLTFTNESEIHFENDNLHVFIQTDKSRYSAGQKVLYRAIFLLPNLIGYNGTTFVSITDGKNNRIHVNGPAYPRDGVISGEFTLSREPNFGDWTITASAKDKTVSKGITVNDYVLPKFIVDISLDNDIKLTDSAFNITVEARFTFKTDVYGQCTLQIYNTQETNRYVEYNKEITGSANFTVLMADLQQKLCLSCEINIRALVTDNATALTMAAERELTLTTDKHTVLSPISITQQYPQNYFVPGIEYYSTVFVGRDDKPLGITGQIKVKATVTTSQVRPCLLNNPPTQWLDVQTTTLNPFNITFDRYGVAALKLQFPAYTESADVQLDYESATLSLSLKPVFDTAVTMMRIYPDVTSAQPGDTIVFKMESTDMLSGNLHIEIYAQGTRLGGNVIQLSSQKSAQFAVDVNERMVPEMYVLASHVTKHGILISDEARFKIHGLPFLNKVNVAFDADNLQPGQIVQMTITADPNSTVYVLSEDEKNRLLGSDNDIYLYEIRDKVVNSNYNTHNNIAHYPKRKRSTQLKVTTTSAKNNSYRSLGIYSDTDDMFIKTGVVVLTDLHFIEIKTSPIPPSQTSKLPTKCVMHTTTPFSPTYASWIPGTVPTPAPGQTYAPYIIPTPGPGQTYAPVKFSTYVPGMVPTPGGITPAPGLAPIETIRSRFPETWLWTEYKINSAGKLVISLNVPDSMTSWVTSVFATNPNTGFGIPELKPKITVKKPFFVTMDLPESIILGEEFLLQLTAFNYLNSRQQVFLQITTSDRPNDPLPASTVVPPGQGHSTYVHITPTKTGSLQIDVVAKAGFFSTSATDHLLKNVTVKPPGVKREENTAHLVSVSSSSIFTDTVILKDPPNMVSGTKHDKVRITGNFMVPSIEGLQNLIRMPYGCGEQTMLNFAPDIYITKYLQAVGKLTADVERRAKEFLRSGLQRELTYQHRDGSFSAFGDQDSSGSSWLTAFVLKCFRQAESLIQIDESITSTALVWLLRFQRSDGEFYESGRIIHTQMQAGTSSGMKLTAFILISILENRHIKGVDEKVVNQTVSRAQSYLELQINHISDAYTLGITCYALAKAGSSQKSTCYTKLKNASTLDGDKMYWIHTTRTSKKRDASQLQTRAVSADIEVTSYALLSYMEMGKYSEAYPIVEWLVGQRNPSGGFQSTQDTIVSLQALAAYSSFASNPPGTYAVTFNAYTGSFHHSHTITPTTMDVMHEFELPDASQNILLQGMGNGIAVVDVITTYYVEGNQGDSKLSVTGTITKESLNSITVRVCITWNDVSASGMLVSEIQTPTGFSADGDELKKQTVIKRHESNGRTLAIYLDGIAPRQNVCVDVKMNRQDPVVKNQACHITVYDYYQPTNQAMILYESGLLKSTNICDVCPLCGFCQGSTGLGLVG